MSGGEVFVLFACGLVTALYWGWWLYAAFATSPLVRPGRRRGALLLGLVGSLGIVLAALLTGADPVVRSSPGYVVLFLAGAAVALAATTAAGTVLGVSALDDAVRRPNPAAVWATVGAWVGSALCVAGANVGRGGTIGTTNGPLALAVATLLALWAILAAGAGGLGAVSVDRDEPSGVRLATLLIAWGLILGRAVAGDWESVGRTWEDFFTCGWPSVALLVVAIPVERVLRPGVRRPSPSWAAGVGPAVGYLIAATGWVAWLGRPT